MTAYNENFSFWSKIFPQQAELLKKSSKELASERSLYPLTPPPSKYSIWMIYGIPNFEALKVAEEWASEQEARVVIILEENPANFKQFLGDENASAFLHNPPFWFCYFTNESTLSDALILLGQTFPFHKIFCQAIPSKQQDKFIDLKNRATYLWNHFKDIANEYKGHGSGLTRNLYHNLFLLPISKSFGGLAGKFKDIPAVVVGAGPSLSKNRELLKSLQNRALILAGGTSVNALEAGGIHPHFASGIDPNPTYFNRLMTSTSWNVPFIYNHRMYHHAIPLAHGTKIFLNLPSGVSIDRWVYQKLGREEPIIVKEGFLNVINMAARIAIKLGCNPIIFVGIDLAYTGDKSYASGLAKAATHTVSFDFRTKTIHEDIIQSTDYQGNPIATLQKWKNEALWYGKLAKENKSITFINATEGGLGFPGVKNMTLEEAAKTYLTKEYDIPALMQRALDEAPYCTDKEATAIASILKEFENEMIVCEQKVKEAIEKLEQNPQEGDYSSPILTFYNEIKENPVYTHLLQVFDKYHLSFMILQFRRMDAEASIDNTKKNNTKKQQYHLARLKQFQFVLAQNRHYLNEALSKLPVYHYDKNRNELGIPGFEKILNGEINIYYPNGQLSRKLHYKQGVKDGSEELWYVTGQPLLKSMFSDGKSIGKAEQWHSNGILARSFEYGENGELINAQIWTEKGLPFNEREYDKDTYLKQVLNQLTLLKRALHILLDHSKGLYKPQETETLATAVQKLETYLTEVSQKKSADTGEPIWRTPEVGSYIEQNVQHITQKLQILMDGFQKWLQQLRPN